MPNILGETTEDKRNNFTKNIEELTRQFEENEKERQLKKYLDSIGNKENPKEGIELMIQQKQIGYYQETNYINKFFEYINKYLTQAQKQYGQKTVDHLKKDIEQALELAWKAEKISKETLEKWRSQNITNIIKDSERKIEDTIDNKFTETFTTAYEAVMQKKPDFVEGPPSFSDFTKELLIGIKNLPEDKNQAINIVSSVLQLMELAGNISEKNYESTFGPIIRQTRDYELVKTQLGANLNPEEQQYTEKVYIHGEILDFYEIRKIIIHTLFNNEKIKPLLEEDAIKPLLTKIPENERSEELKKAVE